MADYRDDGRSRYGRDRGNMSPDDDDRRWRSGGGGDGWNEGRREQMGWGSGGGGSGDRGFFERAGDEVRSWLGDDEAERRRGGERSREGTDHGHSYRSNQAGTGSSGERETWGGGSDWGSGGSGSRSDYSAQRGGHWDESYLRWRQQQIEQMDREYEEYRRERQQRFDTDFHSWRETRQGGGGMTGFGGEGSSGQGTQSGSSGSSGSAEAGATTTGGGTGSATGSSFGSSNDPG